MRTLGNLERFVVATVVASFWLAVQPCSGQGTLRFTFDGPPAQPPGTAMLVDSYYEGGMSFTPIPPDTVFARRGGGFVGYPENGTAYLQVGFGGTLSCAFTNGAVFDMVSIDLAEYSDVLSDPTTVQFIGYRYDGTIVTTSFTTDGIIDGLGPLSDFQTFAFDSSFTDLYRVDIPSSPWSLDNLVISVPEPSTAALLLLGIFVITVRRAYPKR